MLSFTIFSSGTLADVPLQEIQLITIKMRKTIERTTLVNMNRSGKKWANNLQYNGFTFNVKIAIAIVSV